MSDAVKAERHLRLAVISGFYDLGSASGAAFAKTGITADRLTVWRLAGGHEVYSTVFGGEEARPLFNEAVRKFVRTGPLVLSKSPVVGAH